MDDVAAAAGVSRATVSRALSGDGRFVSADTLRAIQVAVKKTGYVLNQHARSLATQRSQSVAFVLCEPSQRLMADPAMALLLTTCAQNLASRGFSLSLLIPEEFDNRDQVHEHVISGQVGGAMVVSSRAGEPLVGQLHRNGVPVVVYGAPAQPGLPVSQVVAEDRGGAATIVRYLRDCGRKTIATISGPAHLSCAIQRLDGWRDAAGEGAADQLVAVGDYTCASGRAAMASLLHRAPHLDAVFVASDLMAAGAMTTLRRAGRRIPDDVAVAGYGDSPVATTLEPALTTVRQPLARAATEMVRMLRDLLDGQPPAAVVLDGELVIRDSA